ncbi:Asparagine synthase [Novipirellula aureliae]|uniref:Asparagine synthase n=1 Tax=Novipirellula aureliae TaxID=2527966 RepID=A0A5C6DYW3_9BACT|nr:asparagine synthase-related protein [Novipirellula aureliae]TWU40256.1 Asparagine synthase [Novipirellula aureliae]
MTNPNSQATNPKPLRQFVDLVDPAANLFLSCSQSQADEAIQSGDVEQIRRINGQYAVLQPTGPLLRMARTIARPMRYYYADFEDKSFLVVAERIDEIYEFLVAQGCAASFDSALTRMVPAHYLCEIDLTESSDVSPRYERFLRPERNRLPVDLDLIGKTYIGQLTQELNRWLDVLPDDEPIGVMFSGGIDSGSVLLLLHHLLSERSDSLDRLRAFTLSIGGEGDDRKQAIDFLNTLNLTSFVEEVDVPLSQVDFRKAIAAVEDYKPLDIQSATAGYAICEAIRERYPDWRWLVDGDGGDENLKDYPIEDNPGLTIDHVLGHTLLYQEGWGIDAVKHSKTYSGGQSRGHVRTWAPGRLLGFSGFSPYALPNMIDIAEGIPFAELTERKPEKLYALKGEVVRRGVKQITGFEMPIYPKRRFQRGAVSSQTFEQIFPSTARDYRNEFDRLQA